MVGDLLDFECALSTQGRRACTNHIHSPQLSCGVCLPPGGRVKGIVNIPRNLPGRDPKSQAALEHWLGERLFDWSGVSVAHLRPTYFAEWFFCLAELVRQGRMPVPFGTTGRPAPVGIEDQASVIASILDNPTPHAGETYPLSGPVELTHPEIAAIIGRSREEVK